MRAKKRKEGRLGTGGENRRKTDEGCLGEKQGRYNEKIVYSYRGGNRKGGRKEEE